MIMPNSAEQTANELLEVVPAIMRNVRAQMRNHRGLDLSVPQFRSLAYLTSHDGCSLSDLAEFIGLTLPSASKLIDGLVMRKLVTRDPSSDDRRRIMLRLTESGWVTWNTAYVATRSYLSELLTILSDVDRGTVIACMQLLRPLVTSQNTNVLVQS